jgi:hypothetical protein
MQHAISLLVIREKALSLFDDLKNEAMPEQSQEAYFRANQP